MPGLEYYYLTHALLVLADRFRQYPSPAIRRLIDYTRAASLPVFRVYVLDDEMSIFLLWLKGVSAATNVMVEANATEITSRWNRKTSLHPLVTDASALPVSASASPPLTLRRESELTPLARGLDFLSARIPGYSIAADTPDRFYAKFCAGVQLLVERYGLVRACLKPARSGSGARIVTNISLLDPAELGHLGKKASQTEEDYVLDAQVDYLIGGTNRAAFILAPSLRVLDGVLGEGATFQFLLGSVWHGNVCIESLPAFLTVGA